VTIDWDGLQRAYDWAKEWQILLAGVLVFFAALIVAWAIVRGAKLGSSPRLDTKTRSPADLRLASPAGSAASNPAPYAAHAAAAQSGELISTLEQMRSLIRSALAALPASGEKENNPASFVCQRILHLRLDQLPSVNLGKAAQEDHAVLLKQLNLLRSHLKKDAAPAEMSEILVQLNGSARNLVAALIPASENRRQAVQDLR